MAYPAKPVVIVGGGPAGCAAAITLARAGVSVVMYEQGKYERLKPCGDALTGTAIELLAQLGLDEIGLGDIGGTAYTSIDLCERGRLLWRVTGTLGSGWVVPRARLDQALRDLSASLGCTVQHRHTVRAISAAKRSLNLSVREPKGEGRVVSAAAVVLAHGATGRLSRSWGIDGNPERGASVTWYGPSLNPDTLAFDFRPECRPGYAWHFASEGASANHGVCALAPVGGHRLIELAKQRRGPEHLPEGHLRGGLGPLWTGRGFRWHDDRGVLACGDAAGLVDPLTGEGISAALLSGQQAARALIRWKFGRASSESLYSYSAWVNTAFSRLYAATPGRQLWSALAGTSASKWMSTNRTPD